MAAMKICITNFTIYIFRQMIFSYYYFLFYLIASMKTTQCRTVVTP
jgi:hypothetical protein